jgi:hypothetical protein
MLRNNLEAQPGLWFHLEEVDKTRLRQMSSKEFLFLSLNTFSIWVHHTFFPHTYVCTIFPEISRFKHCAAVIKIKVDLIAQKGPMNGNVTHKKFTYVQNSAFNFSHKTTRFLSTQVHLCTYADRKINKS